MEIESHITNNPNQKRDNTIMNNIQKLLSLSKQVECQIELGLQNLDNIQKTAVFDSVFNIVIMLRDADVFSCLYQDLLDYSDKLCMLDDDGDHEGLVKTYQEFVAVVRLAFDSALTQSSIQA